MICFLMAVFYRHKRFMVRKNIGDTLKNVPA